MTGLFWLRCFWYAYLSNEEDEVLRGLEKGLVCEGNAPAVVAEPVAESCTSESAGGSEGESQGGGGIESNTGSEIERARAHDATSITVP